MDIDLPRNIAVAILQMFYLFPLTIDNIENNKDYLSLLIKQILKSTFPKIKIQIYDFIKGNDGVAGNPGQPGYRGAVGLFGVKGFKGAKGATGEKGDKGWRGMTGMIGSSGPAGVQGDTGLDGPKGATGPPVK